MKEEQLNLFFPLLCWTCGSEAELLDYDGTTLCDVCLELELSEVENERL